MAGAIRMNKGKTRVAGAGSPIDLDRPAIKNKDGSISTERTITVGFDDGVFNIPTIVNGKQLSNDEAIEHFKKTGKNVGKFNSKDSAVEAAKKRSKAIGKLRN